jgi:hypothetical protein
MAIGTLGFEVSPCRNGLRDALLQLLRNGARRSECGPNVGLGQNEARVITRYSGF